MANNKKIEVIQPENGVKITPNDIELVQQLANGFRAAIIARDWGISRRTIEARLDKLRAKTGCNSLPELVAVFFRNKLIK